MKKITGFLSALLFAGWAGSASAALMAPVTTNGLQWLQPSDFLGVSWNDIDAVCNSAAGGLCSGSLGGNDITGWTWAGVNDVSALFNSYIGAVVLPLPDNGAYIEADSTWVSAFFFDFISVGTFFPSDLAGWISNTAPDSGVWWGGVADRGVDALAQMSQPTFANPFSGAWFCQGTTCEGSSTEPALVILPDVATAPDPIAPPPPDSTPLQTFVFNAPEPGNWFDPVAADAYLYELLGGGEFLQVKGVLGYSNLQIAWGEGYASILDLDLDPGESYFFGPGVTSFMLSGFTPAFDAEDPNAIPTWLDFSGAPTELRMTALLLNASAVSTPATLPLLGLGLAAFGFSRRKRSLHS